MIPSGTEISSSLYGAWRLIFVDDEAMAHFNVSIEGFWRSFFAAILALPYFLVVIIWPAPVAEGVTPWEPDPFMAGLAYILSWIIFPMVAAVLARLFELTQNYIGYITAFNWAGALIAQPLLILEVMTHAGVLSADAAAVLQLPIFVFVVWYGWVIARISLGATAWIAAALIFIAKMIDMLLFLVLM
ncbi:MAG: hypothetical protein P8Q36_19515 [Alphaproteobacteria bacterium]|nr:hypothetical protein [Rhodospirillaceae bacterium]MBT6202686.1 hypothetical protein [Rhodospirillaceae bacterium]MBT6511736.1 hypothetical protein [Rhodospirillaceae bacterium]MBT7615476.1 hypothetical protein [Rhodospirillaceae bacterium]MDG2483030.1 hypothetical protein [Alphaproteobacteria bacterium]